LPNRPPSNRDRGFRVVHLQVLQYAGNAFGCGQLVGAQFELGL